MFSGDVDGRVMMSNRWASGAKSLHNERKEGLADDGPSLSICLYPSQNISEPTAHGYIISEPLLSPHSFLLALKSTVSSRTDKRLLTLFLTV